MTYLCAHFLCRSSGAVAATTVYHRHLGGSARSGAERTADSKRSQADTSTWNIPEDIVDVPGDCFCNFALFILHKQ